MKIGPEHVGKTVKTTKWWPMKVLFVGENCFFGRYSTGESSFANDEDWELVEEPKKPSERIQEFLAGTHIPCDKHTEPTAEATYARTLYAVILRFLDEQHAKGVFK